MKRAPTLLATLQRLEGVLSGQVDASIQGGDCGCPLIEALQGPRLAADCNFPPA